MNHMLGSVFLVAMALGVSGSLAMAAVGGFEEQVRHPVASVGTWLWDVDGDGYADGVRFWLEQWPDGETGQAEAWVREELVGVTRAQERREGILVPCGEEPVPVEVVIRGSWGVTHGQPFTIDPCPDGADSRDPGPEEGDGDGCSVEASGAPGEECDPELAEEQEECAVEPLPLECLDAEMALVE